MDPHDHGGEERIVIARILGVILLIAGTLCLVYRGFNYTKKTHEARFGPVEFQLKDEGRVEIPVWVGVAGIVAGGTLLLVKRRS